MTCYFILFYFTQHAIIFIAHAEFVTVKKVIF